MASPVNPRDDFKPTSNVVIDAEQAKTIKVGEQMSLAVKGKVKGVREMFDRKGMFEVTLEHAPVKKEKTSEDMRKELPKAERD